MSRLILDPNESFTIGASTVGGLPDVVAVFGDAAGGDTVTIDTGASVVLDPSFNSGKDTIILQGNAASYTVQQSGSSVILTDGTGATTVIPVGTAGATVKFADANETLVYNTVAGKIQLGSQVVTTTAAAVTGGTGTVVVAGTTFTLTPGIDTFTSAANSQNNVFTGSDTGFTAAPVLTNLDALTGNGLAAGAGGDTLNLSYTSNVIDTQLLPAISISGIATANLATSVQSGPSGYSIRADTNSWSGLQDLNVASGSSNHHSGKVQVSAAQTTNINAASAGGDVTINGGNNVVVSAVNADVTVGNKFTSLAPDEAVVSAGAVVVAETQTGYNDVSVDGGTNVTVQTLNGTGNNDITIGDQVAPTGTVNVTVGQDAGNHQRVDITGGTTVNVIENATNSFGHVTLGTVDVHGTSTTTSVSVTQTPDPVGTVTDGHVYITDGNYHTATVGTINTVSLSGLSSGWDVIRDTGLTTLSISNADDGTNIALHDGAVADSATNLDLTLANDAGLRIFEDGTYTSATVHTNSDSTLNFVDASNLQTVHLTGTGNLTIDAANVADNVQIDASGTSGNVTIWEHLGDDQGFNSVGSSGSDNIGLDATTQTIALGSGDNIVRLNADALGVGGSIYGGSGTDNTLVMDHYDGAANAAALSATLAPITGFQYLDIGETVGNNPVTINLNNLGNINNVQSHGTTGEVGTPNVIQYEWQATALTAGQSITIDGVTVTAITAANAGDVADAIVAELQNPGSNENLPGVLDVSLNTSDATYNSLYTASHGSDGTQVLFTYATPANGGSDGYEVAPGLTEAVNGAAAAPLVSVTDGLANVTATATIDFGTDTSGLSAVSASSVVAGSLLHVAHSSWVLTGLAVGESYTIDGVTVAATTGALNATQVAQAFAAYSTSGDQTYADGAQVTGVLGTVGSGLGTWVAPTFSASSGTVTLTNGANPFAVAYNGTATSNGAVSPELSGGAGSTITIDGETVTILNPTGVTSENLVAAFLTGNTDGGHLAISGTLNTTEWTASGSGSAIVLTSFTADAPVTAYNSVSTDGKATVTTNGGAPALTPVLSTPQGQTATNETAQVTFGLLTTGQSITVNGITLLATTDVSANDVASAAAVVGSGGTYMGTSFLVSGTETNTDWNIGTATVSNNVVTFVGTLSGTGDAFFATGGGGSASVATLSGSDNFAQVAGTGIGAAPLILNGYTSGGSLELFAGSAVDASITANLTTPAATSTFNILLDGGVTTGTDAAIIVNGAATLDITSAGLTGNDVAITDNGLITLNYTAGNVGDTIDLSSTSLTTLNIAGAGNVTFIDMPAAGHLTTINAHASSGAVDVTGLAPLESTTAALSFTGGAGMFSADGVSSSYAETITAGTGGVTFLAVGNPSLAEGQLTFNLGATLHTTAGNDNTLTFQDGSANYAFPAVVNGFVDFATATSLGDASDSLHFATSPASVLGVSALANTVVNGVEYTSSAHGLLSFTGIGLASATVSDLINAAESIVNAAGVGTTAEFVDNGNTYVVHAGNGLNAQSDTVIELAHVSETGLVLAHTASLTHGYAVIG
ncbi:hypothetical protein [Novosphingobium sp. Fuku2-ISO-50]|uniref:beta strand repeat-containing protein n=1 Tax=Novosphingobium sp. Fuku2-ISO-50 TaxID=1739114 RepID=UPI000A49D9B3|nr:hypothetical protein [Novosphingobium sp. Fuku2-ISO-50]